MRGRNPAGPITGAPGNPGQFTKRNRPPAGEPWVWLTNEMITSPAWQAMSLAARKIVDRLMIEHMAHGGTENGNLIVTYADFRKYGIRDKTIASAIREAVALGWVQVISKGGKARGDIRHPSYYALAWLPWRDATPAKNTWRTVRSPEQAAERKRLARQRPKPEFMGTAPGEGTWSRAA